MITTIPQIHRPHALRPWKSNFHEISRHTSAPPQLPRTANRISPTNSIDEMEAVAALISMPSYGMTIYSKTTQSKTDKSAPLCQAPQSDLLFCQPLPQGDRRTHRKEISFSSIDYLSDTSQESGYFGSETSPGVFYTGCVSLALPEDDDVLSPLHCFMRKYCVEAFSAQQEDIATPRYGKSHGGKIVVGQVGIRCLHCKHLPINRRPERAACFPSSLRNIYHSIETWQRRHSTACTELPGWAKKTMIDLMESSKSSGGGRRHYWEDAAKKVGLVNTSHGVRFARTPGEEIDVSHEVASQVPVSSSNSITLVSPGDKDLVTGYLFLLMDQMQLCQFTEEDREGGRSKVKNCQVGFHGMECKHCHGKAGFGRYFPSSINALALANSDRNIYNHLRKCRRCPEPIQERLKNLRPESFKNKRGSRKQFFTHIWERMHGSY